MAAMCSYQTLARYDDDFPRKSRARTLDDIRVKQREDLHLIRSFTRNLKMIKNRRTLLDEFSDDSSDGVGLDSCYTPAGTDEPDCGIFQHGSQMLQQDMTSPSIPQMINWDCVATSSSQSLWSDPSPGPSSPAWSSSAYSETTPQVYQRYNEDNIPECLFELPESARKSASPASSVGSQPAESRQSNYKQASKRQSPRLKKNSPEHIASIRSSMLQLKQTLSSYNGDAQTTSQVVHSSWQLILDAIIVYDEHITRETINILATILGNNLIQPQIVMHMLQHGLIFSLADTFPRLEEGPVPTVKLLSNLARSTPSAIPFMIDQIFRCRMFGALADFITTGHTHETQVVVEFHQFITNLMLKQIMERRQVQPMVPDILLATGISKDTIESYGPVATMAKCLGPQLIMNTISKCFSRSNLLNGEFIHVTSLLLANALTLISILSASEEVLPQHIDWVVETLCCFRDSGIEARLASMISGLERKIRTAESSEHCSQGVGVDNIAMEILNKCRQFLSFYQQYYGSLSGNFAHLMSKVKPIATTASNSLWTL